MHAVAINVGANTNQPGFRGPVFPDGSFSFVPIPETEPTSEPPPTYADLAADVDFGVDLPADLADVPVHLDPEFATYPECERYTYGDPWGVKAGPLSDLSAGDYVFFYATLEPREPSEARLSETRTGSTATREPRGASEASATEDVSDDDRSREPRGASEASATEDASGGAKRNREPRDATTGSLPDAHPDWVASDWGAYLVGEFRLARDPVPGDAYPDLPAAERAAFANNAHVRRDPFDAAVLLLGDETSRRYDTAVPLSGDRGVEPNWVVTDLSGDSGTGPWWRRPLRFDADATATLRGIVKSWPDLPVG